MEKQGRPADNWDARIRWVVDTFEEGATASDRIAAAAERLGLSSEAVRLLYRGKTKPGGETLAEIVRQYPEVNPAYLLTGIAPRTRVHEGVDLYAKGVQDATDAMARTILTLRQGAGAHDGDDALFPVTPPGFSRPFSPPDEDGESRVAR